MKNKLYVPVMMNTVTSETLPVYADMFEKCGADHVFLALDRKSFHLGTDEDFENLKNALQYFQSRGFSTGVWIATLGYGEPLSKKYLPRAGKYTRIKSVTGRQAGDAFCPEDESFMRDLLEYIDCVLKSGTKMLMLDDELCLSVRPGLGCFCKHHIKFLEEELGESLDGKDLPALFFTGKPDKYRKAWLKVEGDTLRRYAMKIRERVNRTDKNIRVGFCAGYTSWDIEGVDAPELTKILAGDTKPFLRFTGAPYWVSHWLNRFTGMHLSSVCELARLQEKWCRDSGVEVFAEADSYPRPRYIIPSSLIECFDIAVTASGGMGDLKYLFDYISSPEYEKGYMKLHLKNKPLRDFLHTHFEGKQASGVQVVEKTHKFGDMTLPEAFTSEYRLMLTAHSPAAAMLAPLGIPTTYDENPSVAIAFNENVNALEKLPKKLIIDITAAKILEEKGIHTGLISCEPADIPSFEICGNERISITNPGGTYFNCKLEDGAKVLSRFENEDATFPAAYTYKSGTTEFFVLTFDAYTPLYNSGLFVSYVREQQLTEFIGKKFAYIKKEPGVYQICKRDDLETAILFENLWEDPLFDFVIDLDYEYTSVTLFGCEGELYGSKLHITSEVAPFGAFAVILKK